MNIPKTVGVAVLVIAFGWLVTSLVRNSKRHQEGISAAVAQQPSPVSQAPREELLSAPPTTTLIAASQAIASKLSQGTWTSERELTYQGTSNPTAAYESLLWASTGGDVAKTADSIFLPPLASQKAEQFFASLSPEKQAEYGTSLKFIATLFIGAAGITQRSPAEVSYQILGDESGAKMLPLALGLPDTASSDPNYHTVTAKQRMPNGKEASPVGVFYRTEQGWKWVMPPSMIDSFRKRVVSPPAQSAPKDSSNPGAR